MILTFQVNALFIKMYVVLLTSLLANHTSNSVDPCQPD